MFQKFEIVMPFLFFSALAFEHTFIKTHNMESGSVTGPENILFCRCVHAHFSPVIWQDVAVKGLSLPMTSWSYKQTETPHSWSDLSMESTLVSATDTAVLPLVVLWLIAGACRGGCSDVVVTVVLDFGDGCWAALVFRYDCVWACCCWSVSDRRQVIDNNVVKCL